MPGTQVPTLAQFGLRPTVNALVPAPNEAYTQLFWPYDTDRFDRFIEQKQAEEKAKKAALLATRRAQGAAS